ncbi:MAG: hypothetical protein HQ559_02385 [Lentisphaerae bacterium]|nr:hypothetical protein [Lentisphaerota bacterium]
MKVPRFSGRTLAAWAILIALSALLTGCAVMRRGPELLTDSLMIQGDPELVKTGAPAYLLMLDSLAEAYPKNKEILLASADANTAYAAAFLTGVELERARIMYAKARDYGLRVLCRNAAFRDAFQGSLQEFETAVAAFDKKAARALYTTGVAWMGWIINSPDSIAATADMPRALILVRRVLELEPGHQAGGPEMLFGIYYSVQPRGAGRDLERAKNHFLRAIEHAGPDNLLPRVAYAEFYARYAFDRELFEQTLESVLEEETKDGPFRLMNAVSKKRAEDLLEQADDLF